MNDLKELELYIHIPFCARKCLYCDFLSAPPGKGEIPRYLQALKNEIILKSALCDHYMISSVFIGGGTPSLLSGEQVGELMQTLRADFFLSKNAEISMECNPGTVDEEKLKQYYRAGINRLSFGLQSTDNQELKKLGRIHTYAQFLDSFYAARDTGFSNINVDLMSGLPDQTLESWEKTLTEVVNLEPEHISCYSLMVEEGTPFYEMYGEDARKQQEGERPDSLPSEDEEREMYRLTEKLLADYGYHRYEISNYARLGMTCRHNIGYWTGTEYLGLGLGSSSYLAGKDGLVRLATHRNLAEYLNGNYSYDSRTDLTEKNVMEEFMFLGLRMTKGISKKMFAQRFGRSIEDVYGDVLQKLYKLRLLDTSGDRIFLTGTGINVSNLVLSEFLLD